MLRTLRVLVTAFCLLAAVPAFARVEKITVHGRSLESNLEGNSADRTVLVLLPTSYDKAAKRRYPVVYFLHGYNSQAEGTVAWTKMEERHKAAMAATGREFIVVAPDSDTLLHGSMYSDSVTVGNFETFTAKELVRYIDSHYRTIARRAGRGLAGHSMGGYGVWTIGMTYPEMFNAIYAQSACCVSPRVETADSAKKLSEVPLDAGIRGDFGTRAALSSMVAWSPNPQNPPYFADPPYKDGKVDPMVMALWANNSPLAMVPSHVWALKSFAAIGSDVGTKDGLIRDDTAIHEMLDRQGVRNTWATYEGTHTDHIAQRFDQVVLPFFATYLAKR